MTLSIPHSAIIKQYLPGLYFIAVAAWIGFQDTNSWMYLAIIPFVVQMVLNNRYLNVALGFITIIWSGYMALSMFHDMERTFQLISLGICFTIVNLYMSRMLFLNQNFTMAALRENSLDDTLFI